MSPAAIVDRHAAPLAGLLVVLLCSILAHELVFSQLGGYDLSILIDLQWRLHHGQVPGSDFPSTLPPLLLILVRAVSSGTPEWADLTFVYAVFTGFCFLFLVAASRRSSWSVAWWCAVAIIICLPLVYTNHIWHSTISQLCAILLFFSLATLLEEERPGRKEWLFLLLAAALVALAKQNVGLPALASSAALVLVAGGGRRWPALLCLAAGTALGIVAAFALTGLTPSDFLRTYTAVVGRVNPDPQMRVELSYFATQFYVMCSLGGALALLVASFVVADYSNRRVSLAVLLFAGLATVPLLTDWDAKVNNLPLPLFVAAWQLLQREDRHVRPMWRKIEWVPRYALLPLLLATFAVAIKGGMLRERMLHVGHGAFFEQPADRLIASGYFAGLRTGPNLVAVLDEMAAAKRRFPGATMFFGPRIEFGYTVTGSQSPRYLPIWWHPGSSYDPRDEDEISGIFVRSGIEVLVFLKGDRTRIPARILREIETVYRPVPGFEALDVYVRRAPPGVSRSSAAHAR